MDSSEASEVCDVAFLGGNGGAGFRDGERVAGSVSRLMSSPLPLGCVFALSSSRSTQSSKLINDVFRPRFGGDGDGDGLGGVSTTGGCSAAAVAADSGASMSDGEEVWSSSGAVLRWE